MKKILFLAALFLSQLAMGQSKTIVVKPAYLPTGGGAGGGGTTNTSPNLLTDSHNFLTYPPYFSSGNNGAFPSDITAPDASNVVKFTESTANAAFQSLGSWCSPLTVGNVYTVYADLHYGNSLITFSITDGNSNYIGNSQVDISGAGSVVQNYNGVAPTFTSLGSGWVRVAYTFTYPASGTGDFQFFMNAGASGNYYYVWRMQVNAGSTPSTYQAVK